MSQSCIKEFISKLESQVITQQSLSKRSTPREVISVAQSYGFTFTEEELSSYLKAKINNAEGLPRPWGWSIARQLGLVRS